MSEPAGCHRPVDLCVVRPTLGQGGADRVTVTLLRSLDRELFRPRLVLLDKTGDMLAQVPKDVPVEDLGGRRLWTAWWPLTLRLRRRSPQVLFSTSSGANLVAVVARLLSGRRPRLVLSERNSLHRGPRHRRKRRLQLLLKRWLYPRADCVTAVSQGVADELVRELSLAPERVRVVYNPVVTPEIEELAGQRPEHPWFAEHGPILLGVGRLVPAKRFDLLIDLLPRIRARRPPRLLLLGEGPELSKLTRRARELGVEDRVGFAGFDPNPFRYMARCSVFVLTSRHEGLPGALIQAMACGAAVVATDCPWGPAEIVEPGVSGLLVPVDDTSAMLAGIQQLLDDPELRARLGRRGREAVQRFSVANTLGAYVEALLGKPVPERHGT